MLGDEEAPRLWPGLPGDSVALLSRHLGARDLATLRRVSRAWRDDVDADAVWAHAFATRWPVREGSCANEGVAQPQSFMCPMPAACDADAASCAGAGV